MRQARCAGLGLLGFLASSLLAASLALAEEGPRRVLSIGGAVTEIVHALGEGHRLVARDATSTYPPEVEALPDVGYMRALSPEGVLSVAPDLILSEDGAGPPETIAILEAADIPFVTVPDGYSGASVAAKIRAVGAALGVPEKAETLAADVARRVEEVAAAAAATAGDRPRRVLFILSTAGDRIMASGTGTAAAGIIALAGAENAVTGFEGYKQMTDEAVIAAAPDVILMMDRGGDHGRADDELLALPAIASTPAARDQAVVRMDGLTLLGFGPRTADAVSALAAALYGKS